MAELRLRLQAYYTLPIRFLSMGHWDERRARTGLFISLAWFDQHGPGNPVNDYVVRLFSPGPGSLRAQVVAIIHGAGFAA